MHVADYYNLNIKIYENSIILFHFKLKIFHVLIVKYNFFFFLEFSILQLCYLHKNQYCNKSFLIVALDSALEAILFVEFSKFSFWDETCEERSMINSGTS